MMALYKEHVDKNIDIYYREKTSPELLFKSYELIKNCQQTDLITQRNGRKVYKIKIGENTYYFKKYCYRNSNKCLKSIFRAPDAIRSFRMSEKMLERQVNAIKPILAVTYAINTFITDSLFVTQEFSEYNLYDYIKNGNYNESTKDILIQKMALFLAKLYNNNFINGDLNLPGILIKFVDNSIINMELAMVDFDNIRQYPLLPWKAIEKNLISFYSHLYSGLAEMPHVYSFTFRDRLKFMNIFLKYYQQHDVTNVTIQQEHLDKGITAKLAKWGKTYAFQNDNVKYL